VGVVGILYTVEQLPFGGISLRVRHLLHGTFIFLLLDVEEKQEAVGLGGRT
jgi:hypothetical protein